MSSTSALLPKVLALILCFPAFAFSQSLELNRSKETGRIVFARVVGASPTPSPSLAPSSAPSPAPSASPTSSPVIRTASNYAGSLTGTTDPTLTADAFLLTFAPQVGVADPAKNLVPIRAEEDRLGMSHVRYEQRYQGIPVLGGDVIVHLGKDGIVQTASSNVLPGLTANVTATVTSTQARTLAINLWKSRYGTTRSPTIRSIKKFIYSPALVKHNTSTASYLVWEVKTSSDSPPSADVFYFDARSSALRFERSEIHGINRKIWDCSSLPITGQCNSAFMTTQFGAPYVFGRIEGSVAYGPNPWSLPEVYNDTNEAYDMMGELLTFYQQVLGRNGGNGQGGTSDGSSFPANMSLVQTYMDYSSGGTFQCPGAAFYGDGTIGFCRGEVVPNVVAHEYAHSIPKYSIPGGLYGYGEPASLNESFADISGEIFEKYHNGTCNWLNDAGRRWPPHRSLINPPSIQVPTLGTPYPDRFHSPNFYCGSYDARGAHVNSTVPSKAAYLLSEGGSFNGCTINRVGADKVYQIWYRTVSLYYNSTESFNGAFYKTIQACKDLYGSDPDTCQQVERALEAVELDQSGTCSGKAATVPLCVDSVGW